MKGYDLQKLTGEELSTLVKLLNKAEGETKEVHIACRLSSTLLARIDIVASASGRTRSDVIRVALDRHVRLPKV